MDTLLEICNKKGTDQTCQVAGASAKKRVYLSGPITGIEAESANLFGAVELYLVQQGYEVVNPFKLNHDHGKTWEEYMAVDILAMLHCDYACMLPGWEKSKGARLERAIAHERGLVVFRLEFQIGNYKS